MALGTNGSRESRQQVPRRLVRIGLPLAIMALVVIFLLILVPYGRFRDVAVLRLAEATGASVSMDDLDGGISIGGPSLLATNLRLRWPDGRVQNLSWCFPRPPRAISLKPPPPASQSATLALKVHPPCQIRMGFFEI